MNERAHARRGDPETSHLAAESVDLTAGQEAVWTIFAKGASFTDEEAYDRLIAMGWDISPSGARSRRAELVAKGWLVDTGERKVTRSGRKTIVWSRPVVSPRRVDAAPVTATRWQCTNCGASSPVEPPLVTLDPKYRRGACPSCGKNTQHKKMT